jgi:hypothetical protein
MLSATKWSPRKTFDASRCCKVIDPLLKALVSFITLSDDGMGTCGRVWNQLWE